MKGEGPEKETPSAGGSFGEAFVAVLCSFLGIRGGQAHQKDTESLHPLRVILVGLLCAVFFVVLLILIVKWVVPTQIERGNGLNKMHIEDEEAG